MFEMNFIVSGIYIAGLFVFAMILHEAGHYAALRFHNKNPTLEVNIKHSAWMINLAGMPPHHKLIIYWSGILAGWIPALGAFDLAGWIGFWWWTTIYSVGCMGDFRQIYRIMRYQNGTRN